MRSLVVWLLWMGLIIFLVANTPQFFPEWFQALVWGIGGSTAVTLTTYATHIKIKNDYIKGLEKDITRRDREIEELRKRLGEIEPDSIYKNLSNEFLKTRTLNHIQEIRKFIQTVENNEEYRRNQAVNLSVAAIETRGPDEFILFREGHQYWTMFSNETLLLRDELRKRLPPSSNCEDCQYQLLCNMSYRDPFGISEVRRIADDLERLANSLVINSTSDTSSQFSTS